MGRETRPPLSFKRQQHLGTVSGAADMAACISCGSRAAKATALWCVQRKNPRCCRKGMAVRCITIKPQPNTQTKTQSLLNTYSRADCTRTTQRPAKRIHVCVWLTCCGLLLTETAGHGHRDTRHAGSNVLPHQTTNHSSLTKQLQPSPVNSRHGSNHTITQARRLGTAVAGKVPCTPG